VFFVARLGETTEGEFEMYEENEYNNQNENGGYGDSQNNYGNGGYNGTDSQNDSYNQNNGYNGYGNGGYNTGYSQQDGQYRYSYNNYGNNNYGSTEGYEAYKASKNSGNKKSGSGLGKRVAAVVLSAVLFGAVAGGTMYGVNYAANKINPINTNSSVEIPTVSTTTAATSVGDYTASTTAAMDVTSVAKAALPAMVQLTGTTTVTSSTFFGYGQSYEASTSGTGIIVGKNDTELLILTNAHVVESVNNLSCTFTDNESVSATVKGSKSDKDVAVVAVSLSEIKSSTLGSIAIAELGESDDVVVGQEVVAIGNALGEGQSVTNGIISALDRSITVDNTTFEGLFMTNAAINSGNSGGALLNADGKVIGINFAKTSEDGVEGMAYSIPISNVRELIDNLMNRQTRTKVATSEQSYLGISAIDITSTMASYYGYPEGVQIRTVEEGSAAEAAGLGKYDIIVSFDDQTISSMSGLQTLMQYYKAGETVTIEYYHIEGNQYILKSVDVTLGSKK
jgi:serine protease Do